MSPEASPPGVAPAAPERCDPTVARTLARLAKQVEIALGRVELSLSQYRTLVFLSEVDAAAASALAARLDVSRPSVTALIDGLVARGYVDRRPGTTDRRRVEHRLTPAGEHVLADADAAIGARLDVIVDRLEPRRADRAVRGIDHWSDALRRSREAFLAGELPAQRREVGA